MTSSNSNNIIKLCRLCLDLDCDLLDVFESRNRWDVQISLVLQDLFNFSISRMDVVPWLLCHNCVGRIREFYDYKTQVVKNNKLLEVMQLGCTQSEDKSVETEQEVQSPEISVKELESENEDDANDFCLILESESEDESNVNKRNASGTNEHSPTICPHWTLVTIKQEVEDNCENPVEEEFGGDQPLNGAIAEDQCPREPESTTGVGTKVPPPAEPPEKRKRGRPRKVDVVNTVTDKMMKPTHVMKTRKMEERLWSNCGSPEVDGTTDPPSRVLKGEQEDMREVRIVVERMSDVPNGTGTAPRRAETNQNLKKSIKQSVSTGRGVQGEAQTDRELMLLRRRKRYSEICKMMTDEEKRRRRERWRESCHKYYLSLTPSERRILNKRRNRYKALRVLSQKKGTSREDSSDEDDE